MNAWLVMLVLSRRLSILTRHAGIDIPEDERARVFISVIRRVPPASEHNHASRQDDPLVSPQGVEVHGSVLIFPILHHGHAMPARDAVLRRQRVEVARCQESFTSVFALTLEAE